MGSDEDQPPVAREASAELRQKLEVRRLSIRGVQAAGAAPGRVPPFQVSTSADTANSDSSSAAPAVEDGAEVAQIDVASSASSSAAQAVEDGAEESQHADPHLDSSAPDDVADDVLAAHRRMKEAFEGALADGRLERELQRFPPGVEDGDILKVDEANGEADDNIELPQIKGEAPHTAKNDADESGHENVDTLRPGNLLLGRINEKLIDDYVRTTLFFQQCDSDNSGSWAREEIEAAIIRIGDQVNSDELDDLIAMVGVDSDDKISFQELKRALKKIASQDEKLPLRTNEDVKLALDSSGEVGSVSQDQELPETTTEETSNVEEPQIVAGQALNSSGDVNSVVKDEIPDMPATTSEETPAQARQALSSSGDDCSASQDAKLPNMVKEDDPNVDRQASDSSGEANSDLQDGKLPETTVEELPVAEQELDSSGEFNSALQDAKPPDIVREDDPTIARQALESSGEVSRPQRKCDILLSSINKQLHDSVTRMHTLFNPAEGDTKRRCTRAELVVALSAIHLSPPNEEINDLMAMLDRDGEGDISLKELRAALKSNASQNQSKPSLVMVAVNDSGRLLKDIRQTVEENEFCANYFFNLNDNSAILSQLEFEDALTKLEIPYTATEVRHFIVEVCGSTNTSVPVVKLQRALKSSASPEEYIQMKLKIDGVDYDQLVSDAALTRSVKTEIKRAVVEEAGNQIKESSIHVDLTKGSVVATIKISEPTPDRLKSSPALTNSIATKVSKVPGINAVTNGSIVVSKADLEEQDLAIDTIPLPAQTDNGPDAQSSHAADCDLGSPTGPANADATPSVVPCVVDRSADESAVAASASPVQGPVHELTTSLSETKLGQSGPRSKSAGRVVTKSFLTGIRGPPTQATKASTARHQVALQSAAEKPPPKAIVQAKTRTAIAPKALPQAVIAKTGSPANASAIMQKAPAQKAPPPKVPAPAPKAPVPKSLAPAAKVMPVSVHSAKVGSTTSDQNRVSNRDTSGPRGASPERPRPKTQPQPSAIENKAGDKRDEKVYIKGGGGGIGGQRIGNAIGGQEASPLSTSSIDAGEDSGELRGRINGGGGRGGQRINYSITGQRSSSPGGSSADGGGDELGDLKGRYKGGRGGGGGSIGKGPAFPAISPTDGGGDASAELRGRSDKNRRTPSPVERASYPQSSTEGKGNSAAPSRSERDEFNRIQRIPGNIIPGNVGGKLRGCGGSKGKPIGGKNQHACADPSDADSGVAHFFDAGGMPVPYYYTGASDGGGEWYYHANDHPGALSSNGPTSSSPSNPPRDVMVTPPRPGPRPRATSPGQPPRRNSSLHAAAATRASRSLPPPRERRGSVERKRAPGRQAEEEVAFDAPETAPSHYYNGAVLRNPAYHPQHRGQPEIANQPYQDVYNEIETSGDYRGGPGRPLQMRALPPRSTVAVSPTRSTAARTMQRPLIGSPAQSTSRSPSPSPQESHFGRTPSPVRSSEELVSESIMVDAYGNPQHEDGQIPSRYRAITKGSSKGVVESTARSGRAPTRGNVVHVNAAACSSGNSSASKGAGRSKKAELPPHHPQDSPPDLAHRPAAKPAIRPPVAASRWSGPTGDDWNSGVETALESQETSTAHREEPALTPSVDRGPKLSVDRFVDFLRQQRGAVLRAWRLDLDKLGVGWVSRANFAVVCRTLGFGSEVGNIWACMRPDGNTAPLRLSELDADEANNIESFAQLLFMKVGGGDLDKAWTLLDPGNRTYVTLAEFARGARGLGFEGSASLVFKGLDTSGQGQLKRRDLDYIRVLSPAFLPMERSAPCISSLGAWVREEFGGVDPFIQMLGFAASTTQLGSGSPSAALPEGLVAGDFAARLKALGFQGECLGCAVVVARATGGTGTHVSADALRGLLSGARSATRPRREERDAPATASNAAVGNFSAASTPLRKDSTTADSLSPSQSHMSIQQRVFQPRRLGWDDSVGATDRANMERPSSQRVYFSTPQRHPFHTTPPNNYALPASASAPRLGEAATGGNGAEAPTPEKRRGARAPTGPRARPGELQD